MWPTRRGLFLRDACLLEERRLDLQCPTLLLGGVLFYDSMMFLMHGVSHRTSRPFLKVEASPPSRVSIWGSDYNFTNYNFRNATLEFVCLIPHLARGVKFNVVSRNSRCSYSW